MEFTQRQVYISLYPKSRHKGESLEKQIITRDRVDLPLKLAQEFWYPHWEDGHASIQIKQLDLIFPQISRNIKNLLESRRFTDFCSSRVFFCQFPIPLLSVLPYYCQFLVKVLKFDLVILFPPRRLPSNDAYSLPTPSMNAPFIFISFWSFYLLLLLLKCNSVWIRW